MKAIGFGKVNAKENSEGHEIIRKNKFGSSTKKKKWRGRCMNYHLKEFYQKNLSKVKFYDATLWKVYGTTVAFFSSVITIVAFIITPNTRWSKVSCLIGFIIFLVITFGIKWWKANHQNNAILLINNTKVEILTGDIFDQLTNPEKHEGEITVIAVNDYYDDIVDDRIISKKSLHGQYINKIKNSGNIDALNETIKTDYVLKQIGNPKENAERKRGKKIKYSLGSLVEFKDYVLTAFTSFDADNKAFLTADDYMHFWMKFWENIDIVYAGRTINIPLIGVGITRFKNGKLTKQQLLETMLWSLKISGFHNTYSDKKIRFIIYALDADEIDFYHIQHNLNFR